MLASENISILTKGEITLSNNASLAESTIKSLKSNEHATVKSIGNIGAIRRRLIDMGITPGTEVIMKKAAPFGDPVEIHVRGYELSLRIAEAEQVIIERR